MKTFDWCIKIKGLVLTNQRASAQSRVIILLNDFVGPFNDCNYNSTYIIMLPKRQEICSQNDLRVNFDTINYKIDCQSFKLPSAYIYFALTVILKVSGQATAVVSVGPISVKVSKSSRK